jgi:hypothetical protein
MDRQESASCSTLAIIKQLAFKEAVLNALAYFDRVKRVVA